KFIKLKENMLLENNIRFSTIGNLEPLNEDLKFDILNLKEKTMNNSSLNLILAINYGSKDEIIRAIKKTLLYGEEINEASISKHLDTNEFGDVDLLIRTGAEQRLSNFLLWQASYAELCFTPTLWPDFNSDELNNIVKNYKNKHRKFGGL
ncbi:TPA: di-trans,poly-cis-decaprenylcistransferase, partial [Campylobacter fetus subsp. venerealis]|nr:di-trans,poly-cis-decaprenylcistransferase [Campylobacter fetus subsp. venerealis]